MILDPKQASSTRLQPAFEPGQVVTHRRYGYRGVIVDMTPRCEAPEPWYQNNQTQPKRDQPWYHVLVDSSSATTYPAQENLEADTSGGPIAHPLLGYFFTAFEAGRYIRNDRPWPEA